MPTCQNCKNTWTWKETFKKQFNLVGEVTCPYCEEKQYYSKQFRKRSGIIPLIIIILVMLANLIFGPSFIAVIALIAFLPVYFIIFPFFIQLSNENEFLF